MVDTLTLLSAARHHARRGWRVGILSGLGGECGHVSDAAERAGVELPPLSAASVETLKAFMPDFANPRNPLDGTGAMYEDTRLFPQLFDVLLRDEAVDVLAVNLRVNVPRPGGGAPSRQFSRAMSEALQTGTDRLVLAFSSFAGGDLDQEVVHTLAEVGVPFLESTETAMLANPFRTKAVLEQLGAMGIRLSIDDFGIGYSSLSYLKRLPIDTLKIDQSFVRDITSDPDDAAIATAIIALAHTLKLRVVAEGVESQQQLEFLSTRQCDRMQGFLFSRPLAAGECGEFLARARRLG